MKNLARALFQNNTLFAIWGLLALVCLGLLVSIRSGGIPSESIDTWAKVGLFALPFFLFAAVHVYVMYKTWYQSRDKGILGATKRIAFKIAAVSFAIILTLFVYFITSR